MLFSSIIFIYLFLPVTLLLYFMAGPRYRNFVLLTASLFFYAWGEMGYVLLMLFSIAANWAVGLLIHREKEQGRTGRKVLFIGIAINLIPLAFFKYGNFLSDNISDALQLVGFSAFTLETIHLPIGISFFTFQAISYIVDVYRREADVQANPLNLALYIALFPQLIAGPIVRYYDIAKEITDRHFVLSDFREGVLRFIAGLGKKVLIANNMGTVADHVFSLPAGELSAGLAWLGLIAYTLQIYFDFSGYSDMAIGLGRMFGFHFLENFNYPYISKSISEFWRRWHISLSSWFRDYLYIPLGGNRVSIGRNYFNLVVVFFLCGLWHGASWVFIVWGLYHGMFLVLERSPIGRLLDKLPGMVRHIYVLLVVMIGWVFFRSTSLDYAFDYIAALVNFSADPYLDAHLVTALNAQFYLALAVGTVLSMPLFPLARDKTMVMLSASGGYRQQIMRGGVSLLLVIWMFSVLIYSSAEIISGTHNPFLYFRF